MTINNDNATRVNTRWPPGTHISAAHYEDAVDPESAAEAAMEFFLGINAKLMCSYGGDADVRMRTYYEGDPISSWRGTQLSSNRWRQRDASPLHSSPFGERRSWSQACSSELQRP